MASTPMLPCLDKTSLSSLNKSSALCLSLFTSWFTQPSTNAARSFKALLFAIKISFLSFFPFPLQAWCSNFLAKLISVACSADFNSLGAAFTTSESAARTPGSLLLCSRAANADLTMDLISWLSGPAILTTDRAANLEIFTESLWQRSTNLSKISSSSLTSFRSLAENTITCNMLWVANCIRFKSEHFIHGINQKKKTVYSCLVITGIQKGLFETLLLGYKQWWLQGR